MLFEFVATRRLNNISSMKLWFTVFDLSRPDIFVYVSSKKIYFYSKYFS